MGKEVDLTLWANAEKQLGNYFDAERTLMEVKIHLGLSVTHRERWRRIQVMEVLKRESSQSFKTQGRRSDRKYQVSRRKPGKLHDSMAEISPGSSQSKRT